MKALKIFFSILFTSSLTLGVAQMKKPSGAMNAVISKTFTFDKNGAEIPYQVTVQENRLYTAKWNEESEGEVDRDRMTTPAQVAKLIVVKSDVDDTYNRFIVLRYDKQVTDTFELVPMDNGFAVNVDDKSVQYILGEGFYFTNTADMDFFIVDEFDMIL